MKKTVVVLLASMMMAGTASASKARVAALQGANFAKDSQTLFMNPAHMHSLGQYLTFEMGSSSATAATRSEGGFMRKNGDMIYGAYLGHQSPTQNTYRSSTLSGLNGGGSYLRQQNPVEVFWGKDNWGASVGFSNSDQKTTEKKEQSLYARFGKDLGDTQFFGTLELIGSAEEAKKKVTAGPSLNIGGGKMMNGSLYGTAALQLGQLKGDTGTTSTSANETSLSLMLSDLSLKTDSRLLYYGAGLAYSKTTGEGKSVTATNLPVYLGLETDVNTWATVRGSIMQTVLIGSSKNEFSTAPADGEDSLSNNTSVSLGLGLKYAGFVLDGTLAASTSGDINGNEVLSKAALTYAF